MVVGKAHQVEPLFGPGVASLLARVFPDPGGQPVCFPVNTVQDPARDLVRLQRLYAEAQTVYVADAPHFQAVRHILYGALHAAAGSGGNGHSLLPAHFRQRPVDHPPCPEVIQKAHHLPRGVIHIYGTGQDQQIGFPYCGGKRLQLLIMRAVGQIGLETGIAAKAGLVEIPGQEKLPDFSAHLLRQLSRYHAGVPLMALPVNDRNFHRGDLLSCLFSFCACCIQALTAFPAWPRRRRQDRCPAR